MVRSNQYKPTPKPTEELHSWIKYYWNLGYSEKAIVEHVMDHFDKSEYGFSISSLRRVRSELGLKGAHQQQASFDTIRSIVQAIRKHFPTMGARQMVTVFRQDHQLKVLE
ncbi:hypothetical protein C0993_006029 [Termitomyces sp. T159_Od127]|nr:hypothetical protein C0993_006029 [Termitomyces sp. T159_Od127]